MANSYKLINIKVMEKKWFIGIDISKKTLDVAIYESAKKADKENSLHINNDEDGYKSLLKWFRGKKMPLSTIVVCMECTGIYSFELCLFLEKEEIDYCMENPLNIKRSMGFVRGKNDKVDASRIAYFCYLHRENLTYSHMSKRMYHLQSLQAERKRYVNQAAGYKAFLNEKKDKDNSYKRAKDIIKYLKTEIEDINNDMKDIIEKDESLFTNYKLLTGIKGVADVNAINTIIFTNNSKNFQTARQYACYIGIAPFEHTSGTSIKGKTMVSKMCNRQLKANLSQAACCAIKFDPEMNHYFNRKTKEGKAYGAVLNAVKFKLVERMFAVVKRGTPFVNIMQYQNVVEP
jgi:transposase